MAKRSHKIAVLSGKGGTGKTLVSVNLASIAGESLYIDCDVEEPNGHLFFKPSEEISKLVTVPIPIVDTDLCDGCRKCVDFCKFNALAYINNQIKVFENICHSCRGCILACPNQAMSEKPRKIGEIKQGKSNGVTVSTGILNAGEASGVPIIKELLCLKETPKYTLIDCPPGTACTVMESIQDASYCVVVAEPTTFGVHNLLMVCELMNVMKRRFGVVINKCMSESNLAETFCKENSIRIIDQFQFDKTLGALNSNGLIAVNENITYKEKFKSLLSIITREIENETIINP
jgi:MinD superfamily P-loop ATPase